ncbi:hypothetical protein LSH36_309g02020 [Paralvinella palmiformis]|uniref:BTB domain-containing protein n=1 Tax=Paralvinella palmiformis TaxID=53620 RepID=A0AAD9JH58_9ANNE|nr:hypothetical protein LSH36_309g02020 [Paralvinella palmiformis]
MSYCMSMECEKSAVRYTDVFTPPKLKRQTDSMSTSATSIKDTCSHVREEGCNQGGTETHGSHPCYTCHTVKSEFDHEHGQHVDNSLILLHKISQLYQSHDLSDILISVSDKQFHAHKLILSSSSDVFRVMLYNPSWPESRTNQLMLKEEQECVDVFEDFLKYMYTGGIHLTHYTVLPILMLADKYNVCDLRAVCIQYMCEHLVSTTEHNHAISWLQYAQTGGHERLAAHCHQFIMYNFHKIINCKDFFQMSGAILLKYLVSSELVIPDEFTLFKGVSYWLLHQKDMLFPNGSIHNDFRNMALEFLSNVRFPMIGPIHLSQLKQDPLNEYFMDYFMERMLLSLNYHLGNEYTLGVPASHWQPRNYTNEIWSTSLSIDNFMALPLHDVHLMFFSSPVSASQADENRCWEWSLDLFPKGIHFERCVMIGLWRNLEICGTVYNNVRLVLTTKQPDVRKVDVAILVRAVQDSVEYVKQVIQKHCIFDKDKQMCHFDNIVPFDELNCEDSDYLSGPQNDTFKVTIIIKPV